LAYRFPGFRAATMADERALAGGAGAIAAVEIADLRSSLLGSDS
jgi:hypothetical protein